MANELVTLLNEAEYCLCVIFLENYPNGISQNRMNETTVKKSVRIFTLWSNECTVWHKHTFRLGYH